MATRKLIVLIGASALVVGCTQTVRHGNVPNCSRLVAASGLLLPTPPADLPAGDTARDWQVGWTEQTGQLQKSNDDKDAAGRVMSECESMHREALDRATRPWWRFW